MKNKQRKVESKASQTSGGRSEMQSKCHYSTDVSTLTQEIESLKVVIDMRNAEISQLKQSNAELEKQVSFGYSLSAALPRSCFVL